MHNGTQKSGSTDAEGAVPDNQIDAVLWFLEHPEAIETIKDDILKAYLKFIRKRVESEEEQKQMLLPSGSNAYW